MKAACFFLLLGMMIITFMVMSSSAPLWSFTLVFVKQILHCLIFHRIFLGVKKYQKAQYFWKKSCPSAVVSLYMSRFSWIREFWSYLKGIKRMNFNDVFYCFWYLGKNEVAKKNFLEISQFFTPLWMFESSYFSIVPN